MELPLVSCVMTTYRRFTCVERSIAMFLAQDYQGPMVLTILNTDVEYPLLFAAENPLFPNKAIWIYNKDCDFLTRVPYTSTGAVRRDAVTLARRSGLQYYICWDDDDVFLPWNVRQCVDEVTRLKKKAWKPWRSFFMSGAGVEVSGNYMEASVIVDFNEVVDSFNLASGAEHLNWYHRLRDAGELSEHSIESVPAYAFNWSDPPEIGGHKQSSTINAEDNFERHKANTRDFAKKPLSLVGLDGIYKPLYDYFRNHEREFNPQYFARYVRRYL